MYGNEDQTSAVTVTEARARHVRLTIHPERAGRVPSYGQVREAVGRGSVGPAASAAGTAGRMTDPLGAEDLTTASVRGLHFGGPIVAGEPAGNELAAAETIAEVLRAHRLPAVRG